MFVPLFCTITAFFAARAGLRTNNETMMQMITLLDGCCSCCMCCGVCGGVLSVITVMEAERAAQTYDCSRHAGGDDLSVARCEERRADIIDNAGILTPLTILGSLLALVAVVACLLGATKSTEARTELLQAHVFCINPGAPEQLHNPQPGTILVVGQVVGQPGAPDDKADGQPPARPTEALQS